METILKNPARIGNFTSSKIGMLAKDGRKKGEPGEPFFTYIEEKRMERRLGRSLTDEVNARPLDWGTLCERRVMFDLLPTSYKIMGDETILHQTIECWSGSPDATKENTACDVKCPITLKSFCQLVDPYMELKDGVYVEVHPGLSIEAARANHKEGDTYYWQIVSNAILTGAEYGELIVYVPYKFELEAIRDLANQAPSDEMKNYYFIIGSQDEELPHLIEGGHYKNLNIIRFEIPQADKDHLEKRVLMAEKLLA